MSIFFVHHQPLSGSFKDNTKQNVTFYFVLPQSYLKWSSSPIPPTYIPYRLLSCLIGKVPNYEWKKMLSHPVLPCLCFVSDVASSSVCVMNCQIHTSKSEPSLCVLRSIQSWRGLGYMPVEVSWPNDELVVLYFIICSLHQAWYHF